MFGFPRFERDGETVRFARRRSLALIAYLATAGGPQSRESMIDLIWPEFRPEQARANLRRELSVIRSEIDRQIVTATGDHLEFNRHPGVRVDLDEFLAASDLARSLAGKPEAVAPVTGTLAEAADLYQLRFLEGFGLPDSPAFDDWQYLTSNGLERRQIELLRLLAESERQAGAAAVALTHARRWLELDPLSNDATREIMRIHGQMKEWQTAEHYFERLVERLDKDLGIEPEPATIELADHIRQRQLPDGRTVRNLHSGISRQRPDPPRTRLPAMPGPLIGRDDELAEVAALVSDPDIRLVSLVGPGGIGKTRLALGVAQHLLASGESGRDGTTAFPDGIAMVELAPIDRPDRLPGAIARELGMGQRGAHDAVDDLIAALNQKHLLLVLDNFEHLTDAAGIVSRLLQTLDSLSILVNLTPAVEPA